VHDVNPLFAGGGGAGEGRAVASLVTTYRSPVAGVAGRGRATVGRGDASRVADRGAAGETGAPRAGKLQALGSPGSFLVAGRAPVTFEPTPSSFAGGAGGGNAGAKHAPR